MRPTDGVHLGLMLLALAGTYLVPFELLLLSYVVLGPAHYFTEISWLHDRKYFLPHRGVAAVLAFVAAMAVLIENASWFGFVMWSALVVCVMIAGTTTAVQAFVVMMIGVVLAILMASSGLSLAVLGILLPTLVHVSLFTLVFMVLGAYRSGSWTQAMLIVIYVAAIALILALPPSASTYIPAFSEVVRDYFGNVAPALSRLFQTPMKFDMRLTGLLAFIYTYHYLNWFIKVDLIRWADVPRARLALMIGASAAATALYFYDYAFGFTVLLALSLVHIVLEFPLNGLAIRQLGQAIGQGMVRRILRA